MRVCEKLKVRWSSWTNISINAPFTSFYKKKNHLYRVKYKKVAISFMTCFTTKENAK